jgi:hypothetical protein
MSATNSSCATLPIFSLYTSECAGAAVPITLGLSYAQGAALANALWFQQVQARMSFEPYTENYGYMSGTSPAAAYVSGVAGLLWAAYPTCSNSGGWRTWGRLCFVRLCLCACCMLIVCVAA